MKYTYEYCKEELIKSETRMRELESKGVKALSSYDINIAAMGDAEFALQTANQLVSNHSKWWEEHLQKLQPQPLQESLF